VGGSLALARYRVTLEALEPLDLPDYLGSTLRGASGVAFRRLCCLGRIDAPCPAPASCPYHLVFETAPPPGSEGALYEGDFSPFWPYLVFGQWAHVGSNTTFSLGRYLIGPAVVGEEGR
jgi:hypothetical protein